MTKKIVENMKLITLLILSLYAFPAAAEIYKWIDAEGKVHFGDRPENTDSAVELKIKFKDKKSATHSPDDRKKKREYLLKKIEKDKKQSAQKKREKIASNKKRKRQCNSYRQRYHIQQQSNRTYVMSPDGERSYLSDAQRAAREKQLSKAVSKYCR